MACSEESEPEERYLCPICCEVFKSPLYIKGCTHTFCNVCVHQIPPNPDGSTSCPMCRISFFFTDLRCHRQLEQDIATSTHTCKICHTKCQLSRWNEHRCVPPQRPAPQGPSRHHSRPAPPLNRSTFHCPLCTQQHFSCSDLLTHVNTFHPHSQASVVCPICSSMPWGVANQLSQNFVKHLNMRHKFEYDTFVEYGEDEEVTLQATLEASLTNQ